LKAGNITMSLLFKIPTELFYNIKSFLSKSPSSHIDLTADVAGVGLSASSSITIDPEDTYQQKADAAVCGNGDADWKAFVISCSFFLSLKKETIYYDLNNFYSWKFLLNDSFRAEVMNHRINNSFYQLSLHFSPLIETGKHRSSDYPVIPLDKLPACHKVIINHCHVLSPFISDCSSSSVASFHIFRAFNCTIAVDLPRVSTTSSSRVIPAISSVGATEGGEATGSSSSSTLPSEQEKERILWNYYSAVPHFSFVFSKHLSSILPFSSTSSLDLSYSDNLVDLSSLATTTLSFPKCTSLNLSSCNHLRNVHLLSPSSSLFPSLRSVNLSRCYWLEDISPLKNILEVNLKGCNSLTDISCLKDGSIQSLSLAHCHNVLDLSSLPKSLSDLDLTSYRGERLPVSLSSHIRRLNLSWCSSLVEVPYLEKIEELNVSHCNVTDLSSVVVKKPSVVEISEADGEEEGAISNEEVSEVAVTVVEEKKSNLRKLNISHTPIQDLLPILSASPYLSYLHIGGGGNNGLIASYLDSLKVWEAENEKEGNQIQEKKEKLTLILDNDYLGIESFFLLKNITDLRIYHFHRLKSFNALSLSSSSTSFSSLSSLFLQYCHGFKELDFSSFSFSCLDSVTIEYCSNLLKVIIGKKPEDKQVDQTVTNDDDCLKHNKKVTNMIRNLKIANCNSLGMVKVYPSSFSSAKDVISMKSLEIHHCRDSQSVLNNNNGPIFLPPPGSAASEELRRRTASSIPSYSPILIDYEDSFIHSIKIVASNRMYEPLLIGGKHDYLFRSYMIDK
jgi:hypothetical protein